MKMLFFFVSFFFFVEVASAGTLYPEKIDDFSKWDSLKNIYQKIYSDVNEEDQNEILLRMKDHQDFLSFRSGEKVQDYLLDTLQILSERRVPDEAFLFDLSSQDQVFQSQTASEIYTFEKNLLRLENNLSRRNVFRSLFSNDSLKDSPFDVIVDLDRIDEIFFGKKYREQYPGAPAWLVYKKTKDFVLEKDKHQDQTKKGIGAPLNNTSYYEQNGSIVGVLASLFEIPGALSKLSAVSLMAGISTTRFFEPAQGAGTTEETGSLQVKGFSSPPDKSQPGAESAKNETPGIEFYGILKDVLDRGDCVEITEDFEITDRELSVSSEVSEMRMCSRTSENRFFSRLREILDRGKIFFEKAHFGTEGISGMNDMISHFNKNLSSFLSHAKENRNNTDRFFLKPQK